MKTDKPKYLDDNFIPKCCTMILWKREARREKYRNLARESVELYKSYMAEGDYTSAEKELGKYLKYMQILQDEFEKERK